MPSKRMITTIDILPPAPHPSQKGKKKEVERKK